MKMKREAQKYICIKTNIPVFEHGNLLDCFVVIQLGLQVVNKAITLRKIYKFFIYLKKKKCKNLFDFEHLPLVVCLSHICHMVVLHSSVQADND